MERCKLHKMKPQMNADEHRWTQIGVYLCSSVVSFILLRLPCAGFSLCLCGQCFQAGVKPLILFTHMIHCHVSALVMVLLAGPFCVPVACPQTESFEQHYRRGSELAHSRQFEEALDELRRAADLKP